MRKTVIISTVLLLVFLGLGFLFMKINYSNQEVRQRNGIEAQVENNKAGFTKMWQIIKQQGGVTEKYKESFKEIYIPMIEGRYSKGDGSLMKWVTEHNPNFDTSLYLKLMNSIEAQRESFFYQQQSLIEKHKQYKDLVDTFPGTLFLSSTEVMEIPVIKNNAANEAFKTNLEPEMDMFN